jgi:transposase, IS6 family
MKVAGHWRYVYRAIDQFGQVIDVFVSARRDAKTARRFFERAIGATKPHSCRGCHRSGAGVPAVLEELLRRRGVEPNSTRTTGSRRIAVG